MSEVQALEPHWGYVIWALLCTDDSCEYLDWVYSAHDASIFYSGVFWDVAGGLLFFWPLGRRLWPSLRADEFVAVTVHDPEKHAESLPSPSPADPQSCLKRTVASAVRASRIPDAAPAIFERTMRLQAQMLAVLTTNLIFFSFCGVWY